MRILAGQYFDSETGLYYWGSRYYDPKTGRGIQNQGRIKGSEFLKTIIRHANVTPAESTQEKHQKTSWPVSRES
jgi:uncharacterized protein RhaS with RHS repeats